MASERRTTHLSPDVDQRFREFHEDRELSESKAIERAVDRGLSQMGYDDATGQGATRLAFWSTEIAKALTISATTFVVLALTTAIAFRWVVAPLYLGAAVALLVRLYEPRLSDRGSG